MPAAIDPVHILESVLTVWRDDGYQRATTRKVAALANISEMTLFRRFGDKAALFRAAMELEARRFTSQALVYTGDLDADLEQIARAYATLLEKNASIIFDFLLEAPRNPELAGMGAAPMAAMSSIAQIIGRYQADGRLRDGAPLAALVELLSPLIMAALLGRAQPGMALTINPAERVRAFLNGWAVPR
jgi:AcrR family transcriptional regulator